MTKYPIFALILTDFSNKITRALLALYREEYSLVKIVYSKIDIFHLKTLPLASLDLHCIIDPTVYCRYITLHSLAQYDKTKMY